MILFPTVTALRSAGQKSFQWIDGSDLISGARSTALRRAGDVRGPRAVQVDDVRVVAAAQRRQHLLERVVGVAVVLDGDVDLRVRGVEPRGRGRHRLALGVDVAVPEHDVHDAAARRRAGSAAAGHGERRDECRCDEEQASHVSTTDRVRLRGVSGSKPRATASASASRWHSTSVASGSASGSSRWAPVARDVGRERRVDRAERDDERARVGRSRSGRGGTPWPGRTRSTRAPPRAA